MKDIIFRICCWIVSALGFSVVAACRVEYGTPYATFTVSGKVMDEDNNPVRNIVVAPLRGDEVNVGVTYDDGSFMVWGKSSYNYDEIEVAFSDVDGSENGGLFESRSVVFMLQKTREPGKDDSSWYNGEYSVSDQVIVLERLAEGTEADKPEDETL